MAFQLPVPRGTGELTRVGLKPLVSYWFQTGPTVHGLNPQTEESCSAKVFLMAAGDIIASRGVQELAGLPFSRLRISARPFSPLFRHLTDNALRGDLSVSRFMCPTCRLLIRVI